MIIRLLQEPGRPQVILTTPTPIVGAMLRTDSGKNWEGSLWLPNSTWGSFGDVFLSVPLRRTDTTSIAASCIRTINGSKWAELCAGLICGTETGPHYTVLPHWSEKPGHLRASWPPPQFSNNFSIGAGSCVGTGMFNVCGERGLQVWKGVRNDEAAPKSMIFF